MRKHILSFPNKDQPSELKQASRGVSYRLHLKLTITALGWKLAVNSESTTDIGSVVVGYSPIDATLQGGARAVGGTMVLLTGMAVHVERWAKLSENEGATKGARHSTLEAIA